MRRLLKALWFVLALAFLVEAWLWDHLRPIVAWVVNLVAWDRLKVWLATAVEKLPPWAVLIVFVVPFVVLLPLKFLEVFFLVHREWIPAIIVLVLAKLLGLGVTAFIFDVTKPKLLQMAWFRWLYELMLIWLEKAHAIMDPIKLRLRNWLATVKRRASRWFGAGRSRALQRLARIRRRVQGQPAE